MAYKDSEDQRKAWRRHYHKNKAEYRKREIEKRQANLTFIRSLRTECERCGFDHPAALDFHHVRGKKEFSLASRRAISMGRERILREVAKCIVLCSNCHRVEHGS